MKKAIIAILMVMLLLPVTPAFAEEGFQVDKLDLMHEVYSGKTLEQDGYAWDAENNVLTLRNLTVIGDVELPEKDCTIYVQGRCKVEGWITRFESAAAQSLTIHGTQGATLAASIEISGALTLNGLTMTEGSIGNRSVGLNYALTLVDSDITLQQMGWMTNEGIALKNSKLHVQVPMDEIGQFWTEMIAMDDKSEIESDRPLQNYGKRDLSDFGAVLNYVAEPEGGRFYQTPGEKEELRPISIVTEVEGGELMPADHFLLRAPKAQETEPGQKDEGKGDKADEGKTDEGKNEKAPATGDTGVVLYAACGLLAAGTVSVAVLQQKRRNG